MGLLRSATAIFLASLEWSRAPESSNDVEARGQLDRTAIVPGWTPRAESPPRPRGAAGDDQLVPCQCRLPTSDRRHRIGRRKVDREHV